MTHKDICLKCPRYRSRKDRADIWQCRGKWDITRYLIDEGVHIDTFGLVECDFVLEQTVAHQENLP